MGTMTSLGKMVDCLSQLSIKTRIETRDCINLLFPREEKFESAIH